MERTSLKKSEINKEISEFDLGWIIGIIEGEGHIACRRNYGKYYAKITITQKERNILDKLIKILGTGKIYTFLGTDKQSNFYYQFNLYGESAFDLCKRIFPYITSSKIQDRINYLLENHDRRFKHNKGFIKD